MNKRIKLENNIEDTSFPQNQAQSTNQFTNNFTTLYTAALALHLQQQQHQQPHAHQTSSQQQNNQIMDISNYLSKLPINFLQQSQTANTETDSSKNIAEHQYKMNQNDLKAKLAALMSQQQYASEADSLMSEQLKSLIDQIKVQLNETEQSSVIEESVNDEGASVPSPVDSVSSTHSNFLAFNKERADNEQSNDSNLENDKINSNLTNDNKLQAKASGNESNHSNESIDDQ